MNRTLEGSSATAVKALPASHRLAGSKAFSQISQTVTEPPVHVQVAYGKDGQPTKALTGFAAKNGVALKDCTREADTKGVEYIWAMTRQEGRHAAEVSLNEPCSCSQSYATRGCCHVMAI